jgi:hydrogenase nickel incorporation protein HypA/HybF
MHEFSIMTQIIQTILGEANKNNLKSVTKVTLEIGELSFLGEEALKFCYEVISKNTILRGSELIIIKIKPKIECQSCGYLGELEYLEKDEFHFRLPKFTCPKCNGMVTILKGKDCILKEITGET